METKRRNNKNCKAAGETNRPLRVVSVLHHKEMHRAPERVRPQNSCTTDVETTTFISKEDHRRVDRSHSFHNEQPREEKPKTRNRAKSSHFRRQYDAGLKTKQADGASRQTNVGKPAKFFNHPEYSRRATANLQGQRPRNNQEPRLKQLPLEHRWQLSKQLGKPRNSHVPRL